MTKILNNKQYDLENRTFIFAKDVRDYVKLLPKDISNIEYSKQVIRSSGSVGANYIEANEALSKKDFLMRAKICRKEVKETRYWLLLTQPNEVKMKDQDRLIDESTQLLKIFSKILDNSQKNV